MTLKNIRWPVYVLGKHDDIYTDMGVTYIVHSNIISILDNKNLNGSTIGIRRLKIDESELYNTKGSIFILADLIESIRKKPSNNWVFVDTNGITFKYKKTKFVPLIWRKINKATKLSTITLLNVDKIFQTFELPNSFWSKFRCEDNLYLGLLNFGDHYMIYDISVEYRKDSRRKV